MRFSFLNKRLSYVESREGYEVLEEVKNAGQSGASLEMPGMDRVRDHVAAGGVSVMLAQDRDHFAREFAYHYLLRKEFEEHGTKIRALDDKGDDSPEGELTDGILDQLAKYERAKIAERTRRGMMRMAREGRVVVTRPDEAGLRIPLQRSEERLGRLPTGDGGGGEGLPVGGRRARPERDTDPPVQRRSALTLQPQLLGRTHDKEDRLQRRVPTAHVRGDLRALGAGGGSRSEPSPSRTARAGVVTGSRGRSSGDPRKSGSLCPSPPIFLARGNGTKRDGRQMGREREYLSRPWELRGAHACQCGRKIKTRTTQLKSGYRYYYYYCSQAGKRAYTCKMKCLRAEKVEAEVWDFVCGMLKQPERIRAGMDRLIDQQKDGGRFDPKREAAAWAEKVSECVRLAAPTRTSRRPPS